MPEPARLRHRSPMPEQSHLKETCSPRSSDEPRLIFRDLEADLPISAAELDAIERLLGNDLLTLLQS